MSTLYQQKNWVDKTITIEKARKILEKKHNNLPDDVIHQLINELYQLA